jgi:hypothetical protein
VWAEMASRLGPERQCQWISHTFWSYRRLTNYPALNVSFFLLLVHRFSDVSYNSSPPPPSHPISISGSFTCHLIFFLLLFPLFCGTSCKDCIIILYFFFISFFFFLLSVQNTVSTYSFSYTMAGSFVLPCCYYPYLGFYWA